MRKRENFWGSVRSGRVPNAASLVDAEVGSAAFVFIIFFFMIEKKSIFLL